MNQRCPSLTPTRLAVGLGLKKWPYGNLADSPPVWFPRCFGIRRLTYKLRQIYYDILLDIGWLVNNLKELLFYRAIRHNGAGKESPIKISAQSIGSGQVSSI